MRRLITLLALSSVISVTAANIDRHAVLTRNCPHITAADSLSSLTVGNGRIAFTVDITGLQSFPGTYRGGVPLTTMSEWGWHSVPDKDNLRPEDSQKAVDTGNGHGAGLYAVEYKKRANGKSDTPSQIAATAYFRENPHRLNLGLIGLELYGKKQQRLSVDDLRDTRQTLDIESGTIISRFSIGEKKDDEVCVATACSQDCDRLLCEISSRRLADQQIRISLRFPYPSMKHSDDGADWTKDELHSTTIIRSGANSAVVERKIDGCVYYVHLSWEGDASIAADGKNRLTIVPGKDNKGALNLRAEFSENDVATPYLYTTTTTGNAAETVEEEMQRAAEAMKAYWNSGAFADFGGCTDPRARELERRVVLSQYLMYVNENSKYPPQESGLTYNTWFGRPHMEMIWWHSLQWSLWGHPEILKKQMTWYDTVEPICRQLAERQNYKGVRWLKMTDPWGGEAPSNVGSFLIWQQPHYIYLAEEMYRRDPSDETLARYARLVEETAAFMADFAVCDSVTGRYHLRGCTAMQETLRWNETCDQPFEIEYWRYGLETANRWLERTGRERNHDWDEIARNLAPLSEKDGIYLAARKLPSADDKLFEDNCRNDHPAVLGALGLLPASVTKDIDIPKMNATYDWARKHWEWTTTWGWDYGMTAMTAARLNRPYDAIDALLQDTQKNTYLVSGHNYQDGRLRVYLPGNGALLASVAMMLAGWDGCPDRHNPGFPDDGRWDVRWEGLNRMQ